MLLKNKNLAIPFFAIICICVCYIFFIFLKSEDKNLENKTAALAINATDLVANFTNNETKSNRLYTGKIIEITGTINKINYLNDRITIILNSKFETFGVICDINPSQKEKIHQLKKDQKIKVKGICKGFLKDVILLNCVIN